MKYLIGKEEKQAMQYLDKAVEIALQSTCFRSRCGAVIVKMMK